MKTLSIFNHKGGVGKTTVAFNLGLIMGQMEKRVLLVDMDPQSNLTALALNEERFEQLYSGDKWTVASAFNPLISGSGDYQIGDALPLRENVWLVPGDISLAAYEGLLPTSWTEALAGNERGFRVSSAIYRLIQELGQNYECDYAIIDAGPNIGALNRNLIISSDYLLVPVSSDLFSVKALSAVGNSVSEWTSQWGRAKSGVPTQLPFNIPEGRPLFLGYIMQQFGIYGGRPASAYQHWQTELEPAVKHGVIEPLRTLDLLPNVIDWRLANIRNFHSLAPKAQQGNKAIFELDNSEAPGQHQATVNEARDIYLELARCIIDIIEQ